MNIIEETMSMRRFLQDVDRFCKHYRISEAQLGKEAVKSHPAIRRWRDGKQVPKLDTVERIYAWMQKYEREQRVKSIMAMLE